MAIRGDWTRSMFVLVSQSTGGRHRRDTSKWIPAVDFRVSSIDGLGFGAVGDNSNLNRRSSDDKTTFSSVMAKR